MSRLTKPMNFKKWIDEHRHLLKPPVGNQVVWKDREFIIMVVGGPNVRTDYHINESEEFFYQLEGSIELRILNDEGQRENIVLNEGDIFLLPPNTPHSPRRPANTIGLVVERTRRPGEKDGFMWLCESCDETLYKEVVEMKDIVADLPLVFDRFFSSKSNTTCKKCGADHGRK